MRRAAWSGGGDVTILYMKPGTPGFPDNGSLRLRDRFILGEDDWHYFIGPRKSVPGWEAPSGPKDEGKSNSEIYYDTPGLSLIFHDVLRGSDQHGSNMGLGSSVKLLPEVQNWKHPEGKPKIESHLWEDEDGFFVRRWRNTKLPLQGPLQHMKAPPVETFALMFRRYMERIGLRLAADIGGEQGEIIRGFFLDRSVERDFINALVPDLERYEEKGFMKRLVNFFAPSRDREVPQHSAEARPKELVFPDPSTWSAIVPLATHPVKVFSSLREDVRRTLWTNSMVWRNPNVTPDMPFTKLVPPDQRVDHDMQAELKAGGAEKLRTMGYWHPMLDVETRRYSGHDMPGWEFGTWDIREVAVAYRFVAPPVFPMLANPSHRDHFFDWVAGAVPRDAAEAKKRAGGKQGPGAIFPYSNDEMTKRTIALIMSSVPDIEVLFLERYMPVPPPLPSGMIYGRMREHAGSSLAWNPGEWRIFRRISMREFSIDATFYENLVRVPLYHTIRYFCDVQGTHLDPFLLVPGSLSMDGESLGKRAWELACSLAAEAEDREFSLNKDRYEMEIGNDLTWLLKNDNERYKYLNQFNADESGIFGVKSVPVFFPFIQDTNHNTFVFKHWFRRFMPHWIDETLPWGSFPWIFPELEPPHPDFPRAPWVKNFLKYQKGNRCR